MGGPAIRVLIADDEPLIRAGIRTVLESTDDITVVGEAAHGGAVLHAAVAGGADVVLLDIRMPGRDGLSTAEDLRTQAPGIRVVMLTSFSDEPSVLRALRGGAAGFVLKNCAADELIAAVRAVQAGAAYLSPTVTRLVVDQVATDSPAARPAPRRGDAVERLAAITGREREVLLLVAEGLANAEIGRRLHMSEATIKTYVSRILTKLDCANRVQAALLVRDAQP